MFVAHLQDGTTYAENHGYWDHCPNTGITSLHLTLPFTIKKKNEDNTVTELDPSTVELSGYEQYYFANQAKALVLEIGTGRPAHSTVPPQFDRQVMAGIDHTHDFVAYVEVDRRGNVTFKRYTVALFMEKYGVSPAALRPGA